MNITNFPTAGVMSYLTNEQAAELASFLISYGYSWISNMNNPECPYMVWYHSQLMRRSYEPSQYKKYYKFSDLALWKNPSPIFLTNF